MFFTVSKFLVVIGVGDGDSAEESRKAEIIDVTNPNLNCSIEDFPIGLIYSSGGFTKYGPLICSGDDKNQEVTSTCYQLTEEGKFQTFQQSLKIARTFVYAASVVTSTGDLWMLGGNNGEVGGEMSSTELISADSDVQNNFRRLNPTLPKELSLHCIAKIDSARAILTGGYDVSYTSTTYFLNMASFSIWEGPRMIHARQEHGCTSFEFNGKTFTIAVGGSDGYFLDSTEYLTDSPNSQWQEGNKKLSHSFHYHTNWIVVLTGPRLPEKMTTLTVVDTVIGPMVIGGLKEDFSTSPYMFNLVCYGSGTDMRSSCYWRKLDQELRVPRSHHVVIPLGDSFAHKMCSTGMFQSVINFKDLLLCTSLRMPFPMC